jgi:hypothetical protein
MPEHKIFFHFVNPFFTFCKRFKIEQYLKITVKNAHFFILIFFRFDFFPRVD